MLPKCHRSVTTDLYRHLSCLTNCNIVSLFISAQGDSSFISPPTSATIGQLGTRGGSAPASTLSPGAASMGLGSGDTRTRTGKKKDSGVGPDVPEIQSPRKGIFSRHAARC